MHSALNTLTKNNNYPIKKAYVLSNEREIIQKNNITYIPIYNIMFFQRDKIINEKQLLF